MKSGRPKTPISDILRRPIVLGATVALLAVAVAGIVVLTSGSEPPARPVPAVTEIGLPADQACGELERPEDLGRRQIPPNADHPPYSSNPPTSGWYWPGDITAAFYQEAPPVEQVLRNLSLGRIAVWFGDLSDDERSRLMQVANRLKSPHLVVVNGDEIGVEDPVVLTAWGVLQRCQRVSGEAIAQFIDRHASPLPRPSPTATAP